MVVLPLLQLSLNIVGSSLGDVGSAHRSGGGGDDEVSEVVWVSESGCCSDDDDDTDDLCRDAFKIHSGCHTPIAGRVKSCGGRSGGGDKEEVQYRAPAQSLHNIAGLSLISADSARARAVAPHRAASML